MDIKYFFDKYKNKIIFPVALFLCFAIIFALGYWAGDKMSYCVHQPGTIDFSLFWDAYNKLKQNYINPGDINDEKIIYGAIEGMTNSLNDPYTAFFNPTEAKKFQDDLSGSFEGIGVEIGIKKDQLAVIAPLKNTPGEKAGLKSGDIITQIDGKSTANMTTDNAVDIIRGKRGTTVTLTIYREGWKDTKDIDIIRDKIVIPSMNWKIIEGDVAYIEIYQFGDTLLSDFNSAANQILQSGVKKIVLDLRNNPGGYLETARKIASYFLSPDQTVVIEDFGEGKEQTIYKTDGNHILLKYPLAVLINQGSASASEILAGALRDNRGIKLIGEKSFGKGSVQEVIYLKGNSFLKVTIAKWLTPNGSSISEVGLEPDIKVEVKNSDTETEKDLQLEKALEIISDLK